MSLGCKESFPTLDQAVPRRHVSCRPIHFEVRRKCRKRVAAHAVRCIARSYLCTCA